MPELCEVRCNKIATVRVWDKVILDKISTVKAEGLSAIIDKIKSAL